MIQWNEVQKDLKATIHQWSDSLRNVKNSHNDDSGFFKSWEIIQNMGIISLPVEKEYGGLEQDVLTTMYVLENFGNICEDSGLSFSLASHLVSALMPIQKFGSVEQKSKYMLDLSVGKKIGAHAITESESGSDAFSMKTHAEKNDRGYVLNGSKSFITNGPFADVFIIYARTDHAAGILNGFSAYIVERKTPGFSLGKPTRKMGLNSSVMCELYFDDCQLGEDSLLGKEGQGFSIFNYVMKWEVLFSFIINVGEMERLLNKCIEYSKTRVQFGKPICKHQAISHKIADMKIALETSRLLLYKAGQGFQRGQNVTLDLAIAKTVTSENFVRMSLDAIQIFGGNGYMQETGVEEYLRNSVASKIYSGTSEIQRNTIANMLGL